MSTEIVQFTMSDLERMAVAIAKSGLFGVKQPEQALALCLVAQAEGLHPAIAARDYNIIQGRPALKADAMVARFQAAGGKIEWHEYTDECCDATISHSQGGSVRIKWDMERVKKAGIKNMDMYNKYPRNMLRARVVSEGVRTVYPGVVSGMYAPEEVQEFDPPKSPLSQWAEAPPAHKFEDEERQPEIPAQDNKLKSAAAIFEKYLNTCTSLDQMTSMVAKNNRLLLELKEKEPELYEITSVLITKKQESFHLSQVGQ